MSAVRVKGFKIYRDRRGEWRCYHRASGTPIDLKAHALGSASFYVEAARLAEAMREELPAKPGTLGLLIESYRAHGDFLMLKTRTRADYQRCLDYLKPIADTPLIKFTAPLIVRIRDKAGADLGRKWGNYVKTCLSLLFSWGLERGLVSANPAFRIRGLKRPKDMPSANRPWSDDERDAVWAVIPAKLKLPIALMMYCGLDPGDVVALPKTAVSGGRLNTRRAKTQVPVWVRLPGPVVAALEAARAHDAITLCATSRGLPWSYSGLDGAWQKVRAKLLSAGAIAPGLTLKGLRHTVATILAEIGFDERTIADMLGQTTIEMARHYSRRANKARKLEGVVTDFEAELQRRKNKGV